MVFECYSWIVHLFKKIKGGPDDDDDDDDDNDLTAVEVNKVMCDLGNQDLTAAVKAEFSLMDVVKVKVEISSMIVFHKKWLMLTSSGDHIRCRDPWPLVMRYSCRSNSPKIFITDGKSEKECEQLKAMEYANFVSFCNGLVLLTLYYPTHHHSVFDTLSSKMMTRIRPLFSGGNPCALFFHPLAKEYRILNVTEIKADCYEYHLYLFGSKTWRRTANPSFNSRPPCISKIYKNEKSNGNPVIANGALHWYLVGDQILTFDMIREEFGLKPLPFLTGKDEYFSPDLLVNEEDRLFCCCFFMGSPKQGMDVWVLEDYAKWVWVRKYVVDVLWDTIRSSKHVRVGPHLLVHVLAVSIHKDKLLLFLFGKGLFFYYFGTNDFQELIFRESESELDKYPLSVNFMSCTSNR